MTELEGQETQSNIDNAKTAKALEERRKRYMANRGMEADELATDS